MAPLLPLWFPLFWKEALAGHWDQVCDQGEVVEVGRGDEDVREGVDTSAPSRGLIVPPIESFEGGEGRACDIKIVIGEVGSVDYPSHVGHPDKNLDGRIRVKKTLIFDREQVGVGEGIGECVAAAAEL